VSKAGQVAVVIFALVAFACGFLGAAVGLDVTQPANHHSNVLVQFHVLKGDTTNTVATRLEKDGLIRNALLFRLLARFRKLDTQIEPGTYHLSANMTMDVIIQTLLKGVPSELLIKVPPGLRVTQYPDPVYYVDGNGNPLPNFTDLPNFDATSFLKIAQTGVLPDGTKLSTKFWFVAPKQPNTVYALEGYLFPDTYYFDTSWTEVNVIDRLLEGLGAQLCPGGPDQDVAHAYFWSQSQCKANAVKVGPNQTNIFTEMETKFNTTNDVTALYDTLTLASIVVREAGQNPSDIPGVADVYYNRYALAFAPQQYLTPYGETIVSLSADPTAQYARDTDTPPNTSKGGKWWAPLADAAKNVDPSNLYNTANPDHKGLPPGPIAAPLYDDIRYVAAANEPNASPYYYFIHDCKGKAWYAKTAADQATNEQQHPVTPPCP
jgi:UPF0755 protein